MKKLFVLLAGCAVLFSCKRGGSNQFLSGKLEGLNSSSVYLIVGSGNSASVDTVKVHGGALSFDKTPDEAEMITMVLPGNQSIIFYANEDSRLTVAGNANTPDAISVTGDSVNDRFTEYRKSVLSETSEIGKLQQQAQDAWKADSMQRYEELIYSAKAKSMKKSFLQKTTGFIKAHSGSAAGVLAAYDFYNRTQDINSLKGLLALINGKELKDFTPLHELKQICKQQPKLNAGLPSFQTYNDQNKPDYFYAGTGKKTVLLFWQSEDKYSAYINKKLSAAFGKVNKDSVAYVAICLDDAIDTWKAAMSRGKYSGKQLLIRGGFQEENIVKTGVFRTPCLLMISKGGALQSICENDENPLK